MSIRSSIHRCSKLGSTFSSRFYAIPTSYHAGYKFNIRSYSSKTKNDINYDGTIGSLAYSPNSETEKSLSDDIESVELVYDKYSPNEPSYKNPIIFLHGLFGSKVNNRAVSKQLVKLLDRDVYCIDLRNHGGSPHISRHDYPSMSKDVENFILENEIIDPILIGHSMGAKVAMSVCLRKPKLPSMLISVDNAPIDLTGNTKGFSKFVMYIRQLQKITRDKNLRTIKDCDSILAEVEPELGIRQFLLTNIKRNPNFNEKDNSDTKEFPYVSRVPLDILLKNLDSISSFPFDYTKNIWTRPSLFIRGEKSMYIADEFIAQIGAFFPQFELKDIDAGHWVISEKPKEFVELVVDWIERKEDL
ncbi:hypothetical protein B5S28_g2816 [[Candida] boidinii]|nr:hypothetical protein B5S28_g2816 [[Candida] boidinii]OWB79532.1 hypothetical protein B5S32_g3755 [[Candida] boidinii]